MNKIINDATKTSPGIKNGFTILLKTSSLISAWDLWLQTKNSVADLKFLFKYKLYKQFTKYFVLTSWIFGNMVVLVTYFDKLISVFLNT